MKKLLLTAAIVLVLALAGVRDERKSERRRFKRRYD